VGDQGQGAQSLNPKEVLEVMSTGGDPYKQALLLVPYAVCAAFLLLRTHLRMSLFLGAPLLLLTVWCFASTAWSGDPAVTLRRCTALLGTVILGTYAGVRFDLKGMLRVWSHTAWIVLIGSVALAIVLPSLGLDFEGRLRGLFAHKNAFGAFAAISLLVLAAQLSESVYRSRLAAINDTSLAVVAVV